MERLDWEQVRGPRLGARVAVLGKLRVSGTWESIEERVSIAGGEGKGNTGVLWAPNLGGEVGVGLETLRPDHLSTLVMFLRPWLL